MLTDLRGLKPPESRSLWFLRAQRDALLEYIIEEAATPTYEDEARRLLEDISTSPKASHTRKELDMYFNSRIECDTEHMILTPGDMIHTFQSMCKRIGQLEREEYERLMRLSTLNLAPT